MSFSKQGDTLWHIHTLEYSSAIKRNEISSYKKIWRQLKFVLLIFATACSSSDSLEKGSGGGGGQVDKFGKNLGSKKHQDSVMKCIWGGGIGQKSVKGYSNEVN